MSNILKSVMTVLIVGLCSLFGFAVTPDAGMGLAVFTFIAGLNVKVQVGLLVAMVIMVAVPLVAPYTKWTGDDWTIRYKTGAVKIFMQIWNLLAGNFGKASNGKKL